jgi:hypothetical protein
MPIAHAGYVAQVKYWLQDHDTDLVNESPPVQNQWYTIFEDDDVRLLTCAVMATDLMEAGSDLAVRWTLDGNVYLLTFNNASGVQDYIYRTKYPSGTNLELAKLANPMMAMQQFGDKRALHMKIEVRKTSACLATDILQAWCVRETLEAT